MDCIHEWRDVQVNLLLIIDRAYIINALVALDGLLKFSNQRQEKKTNPKLASVGLFLFNIQAHPRF